MLSGKTPAFCAEKSGTQHMKKRLNPKAAGLRVRDKVVLGTLVVAFIPLLLFSLVIGTLLARDLRNKSAQLALQVVGQTSESLDVYIGTIEKLMDLVIDECSAQTTDVDRQSRKLQNLAQSILDAYPEIAGITIAYEDDRYLGVGMTRISRDLFADEDWWRYAVEQDGALGVMGSAVGRNVVNNVNYSSDTIFSLVKAFPADSGESPRGVVLFDIRHNIIEQLINRVSIGEQGFLYVVDDNDIVYTPASDIVYRIDAEAYTRPGTEGQAIRIDGKSYFVVHHDSSYSGWKIVGVIPEAEFSDSVHSVYQMLGLCTVVCLLLVVFVSLRLSDHITRPLSQLGALMAKAETGDFSVRFDMPQHDEIGALGSSFNHMLAKIEELIAELYTEKQIRLEAQLKSLQEQIKPHFLYNTLDTISWMARAQNAKDVVRLVDALTNMFRVGLSSGRDYIPLREEKNHVANYLYIQKVRYQEKLRYEVQIPAEFDDVIVPKLILQPLVENAIYHGIKLKRGGGTIRLTADCTDNRLYLHVWDDGAGVPADRLEEVRRHIQQAPAEQEKGGFGLSYIGQRLRLRYGPDYGIQIDSQEGVFTCVTLCLPLE